MAIKDTIKIILYTLIITLIFIILIDGPFNDILASNLFEFNEELYYFFVTNKILVLIITYIIVFVIVSFIVIRKSNDHIIEVISAMDQILKEPDKEIKLSSDLAILESRLNNIRIDLITSQNEAKEAEQKKDDLIMYMAHDLKTPLTSIIGYLTLLSQEKDVSKSLQEKYMKIALDKSLRVEELINQFFEITRYNLHNMPINKQKIDLSFLLEQLMDEFYPMLQKRKLKYKTNKPEHVYFIGDGDKLARAIGNLIKNAISYSYENTEIEINLTQNEENIEIVFTNQGDKIPEYKLDKIFDKFYRVDESRASQAGGAGLGLAITKEIIQLHDGNIYVENCGNLISFYIKLKNNIEKI